MLIAILSCCSKEELDEQDEDEFIESPSTATRPGKVEPVGKEERRKAIRNKILAVGRMSRVFSLLRSVIHNAQLGADFSYQVSSPFDNVQRGIGANLRIEEHVWYQPSPCWVSCRWGRRYQERHH